MELKKNFKIDKEKALKKVKKAKEKKEKQQQVKEQEIRNEVVKSLNRFTFKSVKIKIMIVILAIVLTIPTAIGLLAIQSFEDFADYQTNQIVNISINTDQSLIENYIDSVTTNIFKNLAKQIEMKKILSPKKEIPTLVNVLQSAGLTPDPNNPIRSFDDIRKATYAIQLAQASGMLDVDSIKKANDFMDLYRILYNANRIIGNNVRFYQVHFSDGYVMSSNFTYNDDTEVYKEAIQNPKQIVISKPYRIGKDVYITVAKALIIDNDIIGVLEASFNFNPIKPTIQKFLITRKDDKNNDIVMGAPIILGDTEELTVVTDVWGFSQTAVTNIEKIEREMWAKLSKERDKLDKGELIAIQGIEPVTNKEYTLYAKKQGVFVYGFKVYNEFFTPLSDVKRQIVMLTIIFAFMASILGIYAASEPFEGIDKILIDTNKIAEGDLTISLETKKRYDIEIASLINAIKKLAESLKEFISGGAFMVYSLDDKAKKIMNIVNNINENMDFLYSASVSLAQSSGKQAEEVAKQASAIKEMENHISSAVEELSKLIRTEQIPDEAKESLATILDKFSKIEENIKKLSNSIEETASAAEENSATAEETNSAIAEIVENTETLTEMAKQMEEEASQFVEMINKYKI